MSQERLNNLMVLHIHQEATDRLNLKDIGNQFVSGKEHRLRIFGNLN